MEKTQIREAFERWYSGGGVLCKSVERSPEGGYRLMQAQQAWLAWEACAEQLAAAPAQAEPAKCEKHFPLHAFDCVACRAWAGPKRS